jgi:hypothetical protein
MHTASALRSTEAPVDVSCRMDSAERRHCRLRPFSQSPTELERAHPARALWHTRIPPTPRGVLLSRSCPRAVSVLSVLARGGDWPRGQCPLSAKAEGRGDDSRPLCKAGVRQPKENRTPQQHECVVWSYASLFVAFFPPFSVPLCVAAPPLRQIARRQERRQSAHTPGERTPERVDTCVHVSGETSARVMRVTARGRVASRRSSPGDGTSP